MSSVLQYSTSGNVYVDGIVSGTKWAGGSLTYSFPNETVAYGSQYGNGELAKAFTGLNSAQQTVVRAVLDMYSSAAQLSLTEIKGGAEGTADLRFASSGAPTTSWAYTPGTSAEAGDVWIGSRSAYGAPLRGSYAWLIFQHETGHALGFKEANEVAGAFGAMPTDHDSLEYSVMSYSSYVGASSSKGFLNGLFDYPQTLMLDDIRAIQSLYGAKFGSAGKDVTYSWNPKTGETSINGVAQGAPGVNRVFMTVWDAGARSTYDLSAYGGDLTIDLRPGAWSTFSSEQLAHLDGLGADTHRAAGNVANAYNATDGRSNGLIDDAIGGQGADRMTGNAADNAFTGGGGNDTIDGGLGRNTAIFSGRAADYTLTAAADGSWTVVDSQAGRDGADTLRNIQQVKFLDGLKALDASAPAAAPAAPATPAPTTPAPTTPAPTAPAPATPAPTAPAPATPAVTTPTVTPPTAPAATAPAVDTAPPAKETPAVAVDKVVVPETAPAAKDVPAVAVDKVVVPDAAPVAKDVPAVTPPAAAVPVTAKLVTDKPGLTVDAVYHNVLHTAAPESASAGAFETVIGAVVKAAQATTSVVTTVYNFFTGATASEAVLTHLLDTDPSNADSLNASAFAGAGAGERYIGLALDLATHDAKIVFGQAYGSLSMQDALQKANLAITGTALTDQQADAILGAQVGNDTQVHYFETLAGSDLGAKAAMVGWLLANSVLSDVGVYADANEAYLRELAVAPHYKVDLMGYAHEAGAAV